MVMAKTAGLAGLGIAIGGLAAASMLLAEQPPPVEEILKKVAESQEQAQLAREKIVYTQFVHASYCALMARWRAKRSALMRLLPRGRDLTGSSRSSRVGTNGAAK